MSNSIKNFELLKNGMTAISISIDNMDALSSFQKAEECFSACPNIREFSINILHSTHTDRTNFSVSRVLDIIGKYGKNIETIRLKCSAITDDDLGFISQNNFPKLRKISIPRAGYSPKGIEKFSSQCPKLTFLDVSYSLYEEKDMADKTANIIGQNLPELEFLSMHRCCHLTDEGLIAIAKGSKKLREIHIGRNYDLTDASLKVVSENCKDLITIGMYYNQKVTKLGLDYLIAGCPKFKKFEMGVGGCEIYSIKKIKENYPKIKFS